jgi:choline dehydrogenase-like flavoprotein
VTLKPVDVCIVGSGAGGAPVAATLAEAGRSVVVLEKGPWFTEKDFDRDEIATVRRDFFVPFVADEPQLLTRSGASKPTRTSSGWISCCVGGGTVHMSGFVYRLHPQDFSLRTRYGALPDSTLSDWPITYEQLAPYYDQVEKLVGISGRAGQNPFEPPRTGPYPLPPLDANPQLSKLIDQGAAKLGYHPFETPRAVLTRSSAPRGACSYCPMCKSYGCRTGAKGSTMAAIIPAAVATGRCTVRPQCMAFEVVTEGGRATAVRYYDEQGQVQTQPAGLVVLAGGAIQTARLLLNSKSPAHPTGLGNGANQVGRNLTFSTLAKGWGEWPLSGFDSDPLKHHSRFLQRSLQDLYRIEGLADYDKGGTINFLVSP